MVHTRTQTRARYNAPIYTHTNTHTQTSTLHTPRTPITPHAKTHHITPHITTPNTAEVGTSHPYVWKVGGSDAKSLSLIGTIHLSTKLIYGADIPKQITSTLESADAIFTEVDGNCNIVEDDLGDPDCSASLRGIAPAARHFKTTERHRIAKVLANNRWWSADLAKNLTETGMLCEEHGTNALSRQTRFKMGNITDTELQALWALWEAPAIPWRPLNEWRMLEYLWSVGSWMLCRRSLTRLHNPNSSVLQEHTRN